MAQRATQSRMGSPLGRMLPATVRGRLVVTVVLLTLTTTILTLAVSYALMSPLAPGPEAPEIQRAAITSSALAAVFALAIGIALGLVLTGLVRKPVERMVDHLKARGQAAVEGAPYEADPGLDDPTLPLEFRELGTVVEQLLSGLARHQAELTDAVVKAEKAEESLGIVVSESRESKIVVEDDRIAIANPAAAAMFGVPLPNLLGRTLGEAVGSAKVAGETGEALDLAVLLEQSLENPVTVQVSRDSQAPRWYAVQATRHAGDLHNRILISAQDVTEDRRLQQIRSEIVSLISHDLRSPLAVVIGYLDLLRRPLTDDERDRAIDSAKRNAGRMADLLEDLLSATRAEELLAPAALLPVDLAALAGEVVSSIAPTHSERPLMLDVECTPVVLGEEKRLRQVLVNLVTNAFKYSPEPQPVTVRVTCEEHVAFVQVIDRGPGVAEEDRQRIFERYARLDGPSAGRPGVGLGLYIVRIIAENHGGCVRVLDTPGGGATFSVELPLTGMVREGRVELDDEGAGPEAAGVPVDAV